MIYFKYIYIVNIIKIISKRQRKKEVTVKIIKRASGRCELVKEYSEIHSGALS